MKPHVNTFDNHLLAVEKPAGMTTQPELEEWAKAWVKVRFQKPGNVFLEPIHRIDKPVSGLVLFARTSKALSRLHAQMRDRKIVKTYHALVAGKSLPQVGTLKHFLVHDEFRARIDLKGKESILHYKVLKIKNGFTWLEIDLETGRYHQIRAQFAASGCPIVGDKKYGSPYPYKEGIALQHIKMEFMHPVTQKAVLLQLQHIEPFSEIAR
jgi:23S rRNA pseudouridine1911/1915/1917 synthase